MKFLPLFFLFATSCAMAQPPAIEVMAYSRSTIPGIPPEKSDAPAANNPFPVKYFIYVIVKKGTPVFDAAVCLKGQSYSATLERVSSPVVVPHDPNVPTDRKDTLVPKTQDDVYQLDLQEQGGTACEKRPAGLGQNDEVTISLKSGKSVLHGTAKTIVALTPAAAM
jgi:hypothetical protein